MNKNLGDRENCSLDLQSWFLLEPKRAPVASIILTGLFHNYREPLVHAFELLECRSVLLKKHLAQTALGCSKPIK